MIVAGFGMTSRAETSSLREALRATGYDGRVDRAACPADRAEALAPLGLPVSPVSPEALQRAVPQTRSARSLCARGTGSVAEAAALAAAGRNARLLCTRHISADRMATCAIAQGDGI